jgi:pyruvate/2-oxoglutarate dehydrogenase complex dihydrolipoamide acyltransferase (E2) component
MRLFIIVAAVAASFVLLMSVAAAGADLRVTALDCESHPRRIRVENLGDAAQDLSGWQLQSDPAEGQPFDLGQVGSLGAGQKVFVFQGHLSPATDPAAGYYRWGSDETFNLRANDSTDYVRIVDPQGNTINQRNCEGLPPGATPAPRTEYDPPPVADPVVLAPTPAAPAPAAPAPAASGAPAAAAASAAPAVRAAASSSGTNADSGLPAAGGPPGIDRGVPATLPLATGAVALAAGMLLVALGLKSRRPGS